MQGLPYLYCIQCIVAQLLLSWEELHWKRRTASRMSPLPAKAYKRQVTAGVQCEVWQSCLVSDHHVWTCAGDVREHSQAVMGFTATCSGILYLPFPRPINRCSITVLPQHCLRFAAEPRIEHGAFLMRRKSNPLCSFFLVDTNCFQRPT